MNPFPEDIRRFIDGNIETIDQLEILRILGESPDAEWTAVALAAEVQTDPPTVSGHVAALRRRGLLTSGPRGAETVCRYGPGTPELQEMVGRLLQLYKERPVSMIKFIAARAKDPLRNFADAFRLRREGE